MSQTNILTQKMQLKGAGKQDMNLQQSRKEFLKLNTANFRNLKLTILTNQVISGYCACHICCGPNAKGIAANGKRPQQGRTVAASRTLAFGSRVIIDGHIYTVEDRLARRYDSRFDIYFSRHEDAKRFGIRTNKVTVITDK